MKILSADLVRIFCMDCDAGMNRVTEIARSGVPFDEDQLDQLHQEFDSLLGGARCVDALPVQEYYFRSMARYVRFLRDIQEAGRKVDFQDWKRLQSGIEMKWPYGGDCELNHCDAGHEDLAVLNSMVNRINEGK